MSKVTLDVEQKYIVSIISEYPGYICPRLFWIMAIKVSDGVYHSIYGLIYTLCDKVLNRRILKLLKS